MRHPVAPSNDSYRELQFSLKTNRLYIALFRKYENTNQNKKVTSKNFILKDIFLETKFKYFKVEMWKTKVSFEDSFVGTWCEYIQRFISVRQWFFLSNNLSRKNKIFFTAKNLLKSKVYRDLPIFTPQNCQFIRLKQF